MKVNYKLLFWFILYRLAGVIDYDYTGEIFVLLRNHTDEDYEVKPGDFIAQLICLHYFIGRSAEVKELNKIFTKHRYNYDVYEQSSIFLPCTRKGRQVTTSSDSSSDEDVFMKDNCGPCQDDVDREVRGDKGFGSTD